VSIIHLNKNKVLLALLCDQLLTKPPTIVECSQIDLPDYEYFKKKFSNSFKFYSY